MKRILALLAFAFFIANESIAQVSAGNDTTICLGNQITLHATSDSAGLITQFFNIADDVFSPVVNIGFPFNYFGTVYTKCILSTNDEITFDTSFAGAFSTWIPQGAIPNANLNTILNSILGPFQDVLPGSGGIMSYATFGTAPNRFFVFNFCNSPMYDCTSIEFTGQTIIYEGTNIIETHITDKVTCPSWNSGQAIHGIQNATGTSAFVVTGRNAGTQWVTSNEGMRWTPDATFTNYTISTIPYAPVPMLGGIQWTDINGNQLATTQDYTFSPNQTGSYIAQVQVCNGGIFYDTVMVTVVPSGASNFAHGNATCPGINDGWAAFIPQDTTTWVYSWSNSSGTVLDSGTISQANDTLFNLPAGQYTVTMANSNGCTITNNFNITNAAFVPNVAYSTITSSCATAMDGGAIFTPQDNTTWNYEWQNSSGNTINTGTTTQTPDTLVNLSAGQYTVILTNSVGCSASHSFIVQAANFNADFTISAAPLCDGQPVHFTSTSVGSIDNYAWSFGDGNFSVLQSPAHPYSPSGNYVATLVITNAAGCIDSVSQPVNILPNIIADFSFFPTEQCAGAPVIFTDESSNTPIAWSWNFGDSQTETNQNPAHSFGADGQYFVSLTVTDNQCGVDTKTLPIVIHFVPDPFIGNDTAVCIDELLSYDAGYPGISHVWSTGETSQAISIVPQLPGYIYVTVSNFGCVGTDSAYIDIDCDAIMPSAFTPNADGKNDIFRPMGNRVTDYHMVIYNRWGELIFELNSPSIADGWDGKFYGEDAEVGVYIYEVNATFINGEKKTMKGNLTLLR